MSKRSEGSLEGAAVALSIFKCKSRDLKTLSDNGAIIGLAERSGFPAMMKAERF